MHFSNLLTLLVTLTAAAALPVESGLEEGALTENPANILTKRDSFSCAGSSQCGTSPMLRKYCDNAVNTLRRGANHYIYAASTNGVDSGNCRRDPNSLGLGCGVFLAGPSDCKGSGDDMWNGYQQIRQSGCQICGFKSFTGERGGACQLKIDYVSGCPNF